MLDTASAEAVIAFACQHAPNPLLIVKSTVPACCTQRMRAATRLDGVIFSPKFLRERLADRLILAKCLNDIFGQRSGYRSCISC